MAITATTVITIIKKIIDISIVWLMVYILLKSIRNNVKLTLLFKGVIIIVFLKVISDICGFTTVGVLLEYIIMYGPLALIVIFQPEIRNILEQLGRNQVLGRHKVLTVDEREHLVYELIQALDYLRKNRIGALIVIERDVSLGNYIDKAKKVYADLTSDLLGAIFYEGNPLHDGGVIIQGDRITCAGAVFPTSSSTKINKHVGTRHRAALGLAEETDAICLVVSEETGRLSVAIKGELYYNLSLDDVRMMLIDELKPKTNSTYDQEEIEEEELYEEDMYRNWKIIFPYRSFL